MPCKYLFFSFLILCKVAVSQQADTIKALDYEFTTSFWNHTGSNSINNRFLMKLYNGGFIDSDIKLENYNKLSNSNRLGSVSYAGLDYHQISYLFLGIKNAGFSIGLDYDAMIESRYTKDAFKFIFFGNLDFENSDIQLSNSGYRNLEFSTIRFGLRKKSANSKHLFGIDLGYVSAFKYSKIEFNNASVSFSEDFEVIGSKGDFTAELSDTSALNKYSHKASGISLHLLYRYSPSLNRIFQFSIRNAGLMWMNKKSFTFTTALNLNPAIVEVPNLLNMNGFFENTNIKDSMLQLVFHGNESNSYTVFLPLELKIEYHSELNKRWEYTLTGMHRFQSYMIPYFYGDLNYRIGKRVMTGPAISYGGYTAFNVGWIAEISLWEHSKLRFGTEYITNLLFLTKSHSGIGGFITFTYKY